MAALFLNHRYGIPVIGWMQRSAAGPSTTLWRSIVAGTFPATPSLWLREMSRRTRSQTLAEKHYGILPSASPGIRKRPVEPEHIACARVAMQDARIKHSLWMRLYLAPADGTAEKHRPPAVEVLAELSVGAEQPAVQATRAQVGIGRRGQRGLFA